MAALPGLARALFQGSQGDSQEAAREIWEDAGTGCAREGVIRSCSLQSGPPLTPGLLMAPWALWLARLLDRAGGPELCYVIHPGLRAATHPCEWQGWQWGA